MGVLSFFKDIPALPFADYADFADCVAENQDASDPEAYCAEIQRSVEGKSAAGMIELTREEVRKLCPSCADQMETKGITKLKLPSPVPRLRIAKLDEAQRLVFGWASVAVKDRDQLLVDKQGDQIEPAELEKAAYDFVEHSRVANEMHRGGPVGVLVESLVVTPEKLEAMGLQRVGDDVSKAAPQAGLWVGFRVRPDVFAKVKAGELRMFSIEGTARKVAA